jgi:type IX secretion system PorP/SprF family membrane protein
MRLVVAGALLVATVPAVQAQDVYFSQPFATRLYSNPAFTGLLDDYSVTFGYRNQFPNLVGTFKTNYLAADLRLDTPGQHHAIGLVINHDRTGELSYTRFEAGANYAYHTRLTKTLALSGGLQASYGRQQSPANNFLFGNQISEDGVITSPSSPDASNFPPVNYFTVGTGAVLYSDQGWLSLAGKNLNQPNIGFRKQTALPMLLSLSGGYKFFLIKPGTGRATREVSTTPVASYTRQGGSQRIETGLYFTASPVTLGAVYRNINLPGSVNPQQVLAAIVGISVGALRIGYSYDIGLTPLSSDLGGAHEVTLCLRSFDRLENAHRRLKRRDYPLAPCPAF